MDTTRPDRTTVASTPAAAPWLDPPRRLPRRGRSLVAASLAHATPAVLVSAGVFAWMLQRSAVGLNPAGMQMPAMDLQHRVAYWWPFLMGEALGVSALIWTYLSVMIGLTFSARSRWLGVPRARLNELHRHASMTGLLLIAGHVVFVAVGSMNGAMQQRTINVTEALLPFQASWNEVYYDTGVFAFYLAILLGPTYYLRKQLGVRWWRIAHRASLAVYVLSVWHTLGFGDFAFNGPYRLALWIAQIPLAALALWRLAAPFSSARSLSHTRALRAAACVPVTAALIAIITIVGSGHIGGGPSPFHRPTPTNNTPSTDMPSNPPARHSHTDQPSGHGKHARHVQRDSGALGRVERSANPGILVER